MEAEKLFKDDIELANSNLGAITLPSDLAADLETAYKLDMLIEARAKKTTDIKERVLLYMKEERLSELNTCYYDFYLNFEKKPRRLDATKLRDLEPDIYEKYLKDGSEKCDVVMSKTARGGSTEDIKENADAKPPLENLADYINENSDAVEGLTITAEYKEVSDAR